MNPADGKTAISPFNQMPETGSTVMQDLFMFAFTVVFFALAFLYVKACQKLR